MTDANALPDAIDMSSADGVAFVKAKNDPALWHEAAVATYSFVGDHHDFLPWLVQQPSMDRATAGWLLLSIEGSRFLRGETSRFYSRIPDDKVVNLLSALCERSERIGFQENCAGVEEGFEEERRACLGVIAKGQVAPGILAPHAIVNKPFIVARSTSAYLVDDGVLVNKKIFEETFKEIGLRL